MTDYYQARILLEYVCCTCGQVYRCLDHRVWIDHECSNCGRHKHHVKWSYTLYEDAKRIVGVLHTSPNRAMPACAVCGKTEYPWIAHHIVSQRYKLGHNDVRNIVPVCSKKCHSKAHGESKEKVLLVLYSILGENGLFKGSHIFNFGKAKWLPKTGARCPNSF